MGLSMATVTSLALHRTAKSYGKNSVVKRPLPQFSVLGGFPLALATSPWRGLSLSRCLGAFISGRATAARGTLPTVLPATALGKLLHKEIQIRPQRPSIPRNPSAKTRNDAGSRESASPKTGPVA